MNVKSTLLLSIAICMTFLLLKGQVFDPYLTASAKNTSHYCATDEMMKLHPGLVKKQTQIEQKIYADFTKQKKASPQEKVFSPPPYVLPVVVHIIHQNGMENISDAQVLQGMTDLNEAYANSNYYDQNTGVNTQIQFCLAKRTPEGDATTGIDRVLSPLTNMTMETQDIALKNLSRWDPLHYINIWLVAEICSNSAGCGVAGYAYFPSAHGGNNDGIVQEARWFGTTNGTSAVQVHEMGHYLGLYHTFQGGCTNNDCLSDGDRVCDTPPDNSTAPVPCGGSANSCSTDTDSGFATDQDDMFWDYMDYGDWDCYSAFTDGQRERMHWHIENVRASLLESDACNDPCTVNITATFSPAIDQTVDIGTDVAFFNFSTNADTYAWQINSLTFATSMHANYIFNVLGTYEITLLVSNTDPNCYDEVSITVEVVCPVTALFSVSNLYPAPGEIVTFTNESTNATATDWQINGTSEANTTDLIFTFPDQGVYTICLEAADAFCEDIFCQTIFVANPSGGNNCTDSTFVKIIGEPDRDEGGYTIIPSGDGNFYIGAYEEGFPLVLKMNPGGLILWKRTFINDGGASHDEIIDMVVDSEGMLLIGGYGGNVLQNNSAFVIKYDPINDNVIWTQFFSASTRVFNIIEPDGIASNDYLIMAHSGLNASPGSPDDGTFLKLNRNTGNLTTFQPKNYTLGNAQTFTSTLLYNNELYAVGRYTNLNGNDKMRFSLSNFDVNGNEQWSKLYHVSPNQPARLYGVDILIENQSIFFIGNGDDNGTSTTVINPFFIKTDLQGNLEWVRKYEFFGLSILNVSAREIVSVYDGFIIFGVTTQSPRTFFLLKINKNGVAQWAKSYDMAYGDISFPPQSQLLATDSFLYFIAKKGALGSNNNDILIIKTDLEGNTTDECLIIEDLGVEDYYIQQPVSTAINLTPYDSPLQLTSSETITASTSFEITTCGCEQDSIPCSTSFLKTIGTGTGEETGQKIIATPNGGFLLGGSRGDSSLLMLLDTEANTIWHKTFKFLNSAEYINDMFIDSEGYLVCTGISIVGNQTSYVVRYDYINDNILWAREMSSSSLTNLRMSSIQENSPGSNYFISGQTQNNSSSVGCNGLLLEVDRNTGNGLWYKNYHLGSCESFLKMLPIANSLYTFGRNNFAGGGTDKMRAAISQFDLSGNEQWSRLYLVNTQSNARLYALDAIEDNGIVTVSLGSLTGSVINNFNVQMFKTDYAGNIQWAKNYEIAIGNEREDVRKVLNLPDGYLVLGEYKIGGVYSIFIMKTDKNGEVIWAKKYGGNQTDRAKDIFYQNGIIYLLGQSQSYGLNGTTDILFAKLRLDGSILGDCIIPEDITVTAVSIPNAYDGFHPLTVSNAPVAVISKTVSSNDTYLEEQLECYVPCTDIDTCLILPDADLVAAEALCFGDSLRVFLDVCNLGNGILPMGTPIAFYEGNPTQISANLISTSVLPQDLYLDSCLIFDITLPTPVTPPIFVMLNDDGTNPTPFDLALDFPNTDISECDFLNNLDSFELDFIAPILDLGPDTTMCDNATLTFDASDGFYSYEWFDGSTEQTYTSWEEGTYWVEVTDSCGGTQIDSITITILPATVLHIIPDTMICAGTITLTATGFEGYQWFPTDLVDCDTCAVVEVTIDTMTRIEVVGERSPGCYSVDTVFIDVFPPILTIDSIFTCEGDTVTIFGIPITTAGDYSETYTSFTACDSVHTITLIFTSDTITTEETLNICQGDSTDIFGIYEFSPNDYTKIDSSGSCLKIDIIHLEVQDTFATTETIIICEGDTIDIFDIPSFEGGFYDKLFSSETGCDSTHIIELIILDTVLTNENLTICDNETADIFGTASDVAGEYFMVFTAANDCDSTHLITLEVLPTQNTEEDIVLCAGDSISIFGNIESNSGDYSQTFTAFNTCDSTHTVHLNVLLPLQVDFDIQPSCQGDADGSITATAQGGQPAYQFQWSNGQTGASIENLNPGIYTLTLNDVQGCELITQTEVLATTATIANIQTDDITCYGYDDGSIIIETAETDISYSLDGKNYQNNAVFENLPAGNYDLYIKDADGCVTIFEVSIIEPDELLLDLPEDRTILLGDSTSILSLTNGGDSLIYNWLPNDWLSCDDCPQTVASPTNSILYTLSITNLDGCTTSDAIFIWINRAPRVYIPNVFSPNGDGINDIFFINANNDVAAIRLLQIYDRWGEHVFEAKNFPPNDPLFGWNGIFRGKLMNNAVFVYYAEILFVDGRVEIFKGDLTILK